jgi:hypothetical protein
MSACIDFDGSCVNQRTVDVEDPEGTILIKGRAGLNSACRRIRAARRWRHRAMLSARLNDQTFERFHGGAGATHAGQAIPPSHGITVARSPCRSFT